MLSYKENLKLNPNTERTRYLATEIRRSASEAAKTANTLLLSPEQINRVGQTMPCTKCKGKVSKRFPCMRCDNTGRLPATRGDRLLQLMYKAANRLKYERYLLLALRNLKEYAEVSGARHIEKVWLSKEIIQSEQAEKRLVEEFDRLSGKLKDLK